MNLDTWMAAAVCPVDNACCGIVFVIGHVWRMCVLVCACVGIETNGTVEQFKSISFYII